jgi:hypothetical protein
VRRRLIISILLTGLSALSFASKNSFDRYKPIIDRHPFGQEPPGEEIVQISIDQSFARQLRLSMLFEGPDGDVRVGIIDKSNNKSYILSSGETTESGLELVEADLHASEAMLRKGNEMALFKLEGGKNESVSEKKLKSRRSSYAERRKALLKRIEERRKADQKADAEVPKLTGTALQKHLEKVQMDAIRTGKPPLPMQLTPEMDAQLVAEGHLPPQ